MSGLARLSRLLLATRLPDTGLLSMPGLYENHAGEYSRFKNNSETPPLQLGQYNQAAIQFFPDGNAFGTGSHDAESLGSGSE